MDLRKLDYFLAVARLRSITAAAAELNMTQPSLTKAIRLLERELGVPLFERLPRGVELTSYGQSLLRHAESVNIQVRDALAELESLSGGTVGEVHIGAGPAWLRRHLPLAVARVVAANPSIRLHVKGGFDDALLRSLRRGELDFVVAELPPREDFPDLAIEGLTADTLGVCCAPRHPLLRRRAVRLRDLLDYPWVMPPGTTRAARRLDALFTAQDLPAPRCVAQSESMAFLLQLVRHSDALTLTVSTTLETREGGELKMLRVPDLTASRHAGIIRRRNGWLSPAASVVVDELKRICTAEPRN